MNDISPFDYLAPKTDRERQKATAVENKEKMQALVDSGITYSLRNASRDALRVELEDCIAAFAANSGKASGIVVEANLYSSIRLFDEEYFEHCSTREIICDGKFGYLLPIRIEVKVWKYQLQNEVTIY